METTTGGKNILIAVIKIVDKLTDIQIKIDNYATIKFRTINLVKVFLFAMFIISIYGFAQNKEWDWTILPIPHPAQPLITEPDIRKAKMPARKDLTDPKGAPNVSKLIRQNNKLKF